MYREYRNSQEGTAQGGVSRSEIEAENRRLIAHGQFYPSEDLVCYFGFILGMSVF
jgi:hypothetical protein